MAKKFTHILLITLFLFSFRALAGEDNEQVSPSYASSSVLKKGNWYKFKTSEEGVHKITWDDLLAAGIDPSLIDPATLQLFGNHSGMVPEANDRQGQDDLIENSIFVYGEEDGSFDPDDYILFYAASPIEWKINPFIRIFMHTINIYDDYVYFFLRYNHASGKRIEALENSSAEPVYQRRTYDYYKAHQKELYSLTKSGQEWYGEHITTAEPQIFSFEVPDVDTASEGTLRLRLAARTPLDCSMDVLYAGEILDEIELEKVNFGGVEFATTYSRYIDISPVSDQVDIYLQLNPSNGKSQAWVDYLELNLRRNLVFRGDQFAFRDWSATGNGKTTEFIIADHTGKAQIWDITDPFNAHKILPVLAADSLRFVAGTDTLRNFIIWQDADLYQPEFVSKIHNQNLHAIDPVDYVIVAHPKFAGEAAELASLHQQHDGLSSVVVTTEQIYNEFGGGKQDVAAIRNFANMLYRRGGEAKPRYLLLFGDASYDPKDREGEKHNFIPAFQSKESVSKTKSFVTDDFYGLMGATEGEDAQGSLDIGVGRFPVSTSEQAQAVLSKIRHYMQQDTKVYGQWRNEVVFVADDEDNNAHLDQAEGLSRIVEEDSPQYHINKIYLDAFPQEQLAGGSRFPLANEAIDEAVKRGSLFMNYTGHGGELGWADEKVLNIPMINNWNNMDNLPVFMTATCEFSRFDNPEFISGGELVLLNPEGGGIALFTTSRLSYSQTNYGLNKDFYRSCFTPVNGEMPRLGDLMRLSKQTSNSGIYTKNFVLLGDPALRPAYPQYEINVEDMMIDGTYATTTVKALSKVKIKGLVKDLSGNRKSDFNGIVHAKIFDKKSIYTTLGNDQTSHPSNFKAHTKMIAENRASIKNGEFEFTFIVPRDIDFKYGEGRIHFYALDTVLHKDANGYFNYDIGSINQNAAADDQGPEITVYLNEPSFQSGDIVDENPVAFIDLHDEGGINSTGNGIGHEITAVIDGRTDESVTLTGHFLPAIDDYSKGSIVFPLSDLGPGKHSLQVKAWDMYNNSSTKKIEFVIEKNLSVQIQAVKNYPNPFAYQTTFEIDHEKLNAETEAELLVFDTYGKLVNRLHTPLDPAAGSVTRLTWNALDISGKKLEGGVYIYHIIFSNANGYKSKQSGKLIIVN